MSVTVSVCTCSSLLHYDSSSPCSSSSSSSSSSSFSVSSSSCDVGWFNSCTRTFVHRWHSHPAPHSLPFLWQPHRLLLQPVLHVQPFPRKSSVCCICCCTSSASQSMEYPLLSLDHPWDSGGASPSYWSALEEFSHICFIQHDLIQCLHSAVSVGGLWSSLNTGMTLLMRRYHSLCFSSFPVLFGLGRRRALSCWSSLATKTTEARTALVSSVAAVSVESYSTAVDLIVSNVVAH